MSTANHRTRKDKQNPEIMQAAVEAIRDGVGVMDAAQRLAVGASTMGAAFAVVREAPGLVGRVLNGELTIYKAHQIARRGEMQPCPVCEGAGYVFRRNR